MSQQRGRLANIDFPSAFDRPSSPPLDRIYGLDIETDTSRGGLDPELAPIVAVALCGSDLNNVAWNIVFDGAEADILAELDQAIAALAPGVLVTWNGARFDMPFISDRANRIGTDLGLRLAPDVFRRSRHEPLPGHAGGYTASWHEQRHLDAYVVYRADVGASLGLPCGLKPLAKMMGLSPVEVDRTLIHELSGEALSDYVASDAILARELAIRRWSTAHRAIDALVQGAGGALAARSTVGSGSHP